MKSSHPPFLLDQHRLVAPSLSSFSLSSFNGDEQVDDLCVDEIYAQLEAPSPREP